MTTEADPLRFAHVTDWVFDLDNTLYPHHLNLFSQIDVKMTAYVSELLLPADLESRLGNLYVLAQFAPSIQNVCQGA